MLASERRRLLAQRAIGHLAFPAVGLGIAGAFRFRGHRILGQRALRARFRELTREHGGPFIVCANHLTMIDSVMLDRALASDWTYLRHFRRLPWNIPEWNNFRTSLGLRLICYLAKCAPIERDGSAEGKRHVLDKLQWLLEQGESVCIFPEGTRSRSGRLDTENFGYGLGQLAVRVPSAAVLCVYVRGEHQTGPSGLPRRGDAIYVEMRLLQPSTTARGLRAARDISVQAIQALGELEAEYFRLHPERAASLGAPAGGA